MWQISQKTYIIQTAYEARDVYREVLIVLTVGL